MPDIEIIFLGVWIFLAWMVWKKKTVSRYLKALKTFLLVAGTSGMMLIFHFPQCMYLKYLRGPSPLTRYIKKGSSSAIRGMSFCRQWPCNPFLTIP
ncbi:hypothetical protein ACFLV0_05480, partial [Chloroflexota bacterium]